MPHIISWKLWRALQNPPRQHPLFNQSQRGEIRRRSRLLVMILCLALIVLGYYAIQLHVTFVAMLSAVTAPLLLSLGGAGILVYITELAMTINHAIHHVHETRIYDLLCLTPPGRFGATWAISTGSIYRRSAPEAVYFVIRLVAGLFITVMLLCLVIVMLTLLLGGFERWADLFYQPALEFSNLLALALVFYLGSVQAAVSGILVGMLVPTIITDTALSDLLTIGVFLCIQGAIYLLTALLVVLVFPALLRTFALHGWLMDMLQPFLGLLAFVLLHEWVNIALWRVVAQRLNTAAELASRFPT